MIDDSHASDPYSFALRRGPKEFSWHRVKRTGVPIFESEVGASQVSGVFAVQLESNEAGRIIERFFPTMRTYAAGEYVTWAWDMSVIQGAGWVGSAGGRRRTLAWGASALFAGVPSTAPRSARLDSIRLFPNDQVALTPGDWSLSQVLGIYSDGLGAWEIPVTPESLSVDKPAVAYVDQRGVLHGKSFGTATLSTRFETMFSQTTVNIAAGKAGDVRFFLGGMPRVSGVAVGREGVFVTDQSDTVYFASKSSGLTVFSRVESSPSGVVGMDGITCSTTGDLYVRHVGNRSIIHFAAGQSVKYTEIRLPDDRSSTGITTLEDVLYITDSRGTVWTYENTALHELCSVTTEEDGGYALTYAVVMGDHLLVFDNRNALFRVERRSGSFEALVVPGNANRFSACAAVDGRLLVTDFHEGTLNEYIDGTVAVLASGFVNPTGLAIEGTGTVLVAGFGAGTVDRVLL